MFFRFVCEQIHDISEFELLEYEKLLSVKKHQVENNNIKLSTCLTWFRIIKSFKIFFRIEELASPLFLVKTSRGFRNQFSLVRS